MRKATILIIHGAYGYPTENWFGWLENQLHNRQINCYVPSFPTPVGQSLKNWLAIFNQSYLPVVNSNTILIGHSLGAIFVLRWLEQYLSTIKVAILVGGFIGKTGITKFDNINVDFFATPFNWSSIIKASRKFICYYGNNDPYVKISNDILVKQLQAEKIIISNGGHFNIKSGYSQFPHILLRVQRLLEENNDK